MKQYLKYLKIFFTTVIILFLIQFLIVCIPKKLIEQNLKESTILYHDVDDYSKIIKSEKIPLKYAFQIDNYADCVTLNIIWNLKPSITSQIQMKYYKSLELSTSCESLIETVNSKQEPNTEYSRYWHGSIIILKPLLSLFNTNEIKIILGIVLLILTIYLIILMYKKSKLFAIIYIISLLAINYLIIPLCFEYYFVFLITNIISIMTIKSLNKDDNYFFALLCISGILTCFFDFLTCETLALTIPLFIRIFFQEQKYDRKKYLIFLIKSCIIWFISYAFMFIFKWLLTIFIYGLNQIGEIWESAKLRIYETNYDNPIPYILSMLINMPTYILPFAISEKAIIYVIIYTMIIIWLYLFSLTDYQKKTVNRLLLICLIPITRYLLLYSHAIIHYFFDYRALLPVIIITIYILYGGVKNEINNINTLLKRRKNNRKSNKNNQKVLNKK